MPKKLKKQTKQIAEIGMIGAGSTIAIGALGGGTGALTGVSGMLPVMGSVVGAGGLIRMTEHSFGMKKKRKKK